MARFWVDPGCGLGMGGSVVSQAPCCCNLMGGELGVSWYGGRGLLCSPWDLHPFKFLHLHLLPTLSLPSPSAPILLQGTHKLVKYDPMGLALGADWVRRQSRHPIAFGGVWNSDQFRCGFDFNAAFSTGFLKSCKYLYILLTYIIVFKYFYFEKLLSVSHAISPFRFRLADITFYIENLCRFWKSVKGDHKTESHSHKFNSQDYQKWSVMDNKTTNPRWKERVLYFIEDS